MMPAGGGLQRMVRRRDALLKAPVAVGQDLGQHRFGFSR